MKILVAFGSRHGATAEIAQRIATVIESKTDALVDCRPIGMINPDHYDAYVIGSSIYAGRWHKDVTKFLEKYTKSLSQKPTWLFSSGPTGEGEPETLLEGQLFPDQLEGVIKAIKPEKMTVFHGALQPDKLNFVEKAMIRAVGVETGDFRDWVSIDAWGRSIAETISLDQL